MQELERRMTVMETLMQQHIIICDKRAALAQKLLVAVAFGVAGVLGLLLKAQLHIPG